jgi:hypothetical protein
VYHVIRFYLDAQNLNELKALSGNEMLHCNKSIEMVELKLELAKMSCKQSL